MQSCIECIQSESMNIDDMDWQYIYQIPKYKDKKYPFYHRIANIFVLICRS